MDWIHLAQDRVQRLGSMSTIMNFDFHNRREFLDQISDFKLLKKDCFMDLVVMYFIQG
jgi:hypothetical protein